MLHLHHLQQSRSFRIVWLLEELGIDYQLTSYERTARFLAPKNLEQQSPMGKAPILEADGKVLMESGHIIDYLMAKYDQDYALHPKTNPDSSSWLDYNFWLHFAEASAMPPLLMRLVFSKVVESSPFFIQPISKSIQSKVEHSMIQKNIDKIFLLMEQHLQDKHWLAGSEFTASDIQMHFVIAAAHSRQPLSKTKYANILNWLSRCENRPAFQRAVEKGGRLSF